MPPRKSDPTRRGDASAARFAPIDDNPPTPAPRALAATQAPPHAAGPSASPALALPTMDPTSMPPPSLPPPGPAAQHPDAVAFAPTRPGSASASAPAGRGGSAPSQTTPSEKGKEKEEGKTGPGGHPKEAITIPIEVCKASRSRVMRGDAGSMF